MDTGHCTAAVSCLEAVPRPGRGLPRAGPDRCEDEVVAGVWPCEYCNAGVRFVPGTEHDLSEQLCRLCTHAARHPGHFAELSASQ